MHQTRGGCCGGLLIAAVEQVAAEKLIEFVERQTRRCLSLCLWEPQMTQCHSFVLRSCRQDDAGVPLHLHAITQQIAFSLEAGK